jgi:hypothetical protein
MLAQHHLSVRLAVRRRDLPDDRVIQGAGVVFRMALHAASRFLLQRSTQLELVLGLGAGIGGVGDHDKVVAGQFERIAGQLDVTDYPVVQPLAGHTVQSYVLPGPPGHEFITPR